MKNVIFNLLGKYAHSEFWIGYLVALIASLSTFLAPVKVFVVASIMLVFADLYTGVKAAKVRGEKINSQGFKRSFNKIVMYIIGILASEILRQVFFPSINVTYAVAVTIVLTEFQSLVENIEVVTGVNIWRRIKRLIPWTEDNDKSKTK